MWLFINGAFGGSGQMKVRCVLAGRDICKILQQSAFFAIVGD